MQEKAPAARPALDTFGAAVERGERRGNRKIMAKSKLINGGADDDYDARHAMHEIGAAVAAAPRRGSRGKAINTVAKRRQRSARWVTIFS